MEISLQELQKNAGILFSRENPFYAAFKDTWRRSLAAYGGGAGYIRKALIRHISELAPEYTERLARAAYANYPRRVATLITQYVLSVRPQRTGADPEVVEDFNRNGERVDEVMRQFSTYLNICGCAWLIADMPSFQGYKTKKDEIYERLRPYCVALSPLQVVDWAYGADGHLLWALVGERVYDNTNPLKSGSTLEVRKLWTREDVFTCARKSDGSITCTVQRHGLGAVPLIRQVEVDGYGIGENHWFEDVVRISDAILNAESEAQMNVIKQMFGLLVVPDEFMDSVRLQQEDGNASGTAGQGESLSCIIARSAAVFESESGKGTTRYISPAGAETQIIRSEIESLKKELFSVVGLAASKDTKMVESAEAKAWDFQNVEHFMATRADILEQCEMLAWDFLHRWSPSIPIPNVQYNRHFQILDLKESVASLLELSGFNTENDAYQREIGQTALDLLNRLRQLPQSAIEAISRKIQESSPSADKEAVRALAAAMAQEGQE